MTIDTIASAVYAHQPASIGGGTAGGSRWECACGDNGLIPGTRRAAAHRHAEHVAEKIVEALGLTEVTLPHSHIHPCGETGCTVESVTYWRTPDVPTQRETLTMQEIADAIRSGFARLTAPAFGTYEPPRYASGGPVEVPRRDAEDWPRLTDGCPVIPASAFPKGGLLRAFGTYEPPACDHRQTVSDATPLRPHPARLRRLRARHRSGRDVSADTKAALAEAIAAHIADECAGDTPGAWIVLTETTTLTE
ncbi:hypothetical protein EDD28_2410 [Salana multivorans]|uniref:Uncharacterized protein n=1 Tax=Salana multivorans TaxID=120377 RepID=A0A3N2DDJ0_9MICO|nr:hypothetical protein [Salana multivorans]ROR97802.1 hypothetical protein EDD28_2410 [Salana multivorans]